MGLTSHLRIFLCLEPCDMRKSYNGLVALADQLAVDGLKSGALFLFTNKRLNRVQALYYDRTGICILKKRLEIGTFSWPDPSMKWPQETEPLHHHHRESWLLERGKCRHQHQFREERRTQVGKDQGGEERTLS